MVDPSIHSGRFNCPHCGAFAHQVWYSCVAEWDQSERYGSDIREARRHSAQQVEVITALSQEKAKDWNAQRDAIELNAIAQGGHVFGLGPTAPQSKGGALSRFRMGNLAFSKCVSCSEWAVWVDEGIVWPSALAAPLPNTDLPPDVQHDYLEAGRIVKESPRGAAALLRLAIQKICNDATGKEQDIKPAIDELERGNLSRPIVDALHIVRVVGNECVHPGTLDVRDDPDMANQLFLLVNRIGDALYSQPKRDAELWAKLPETKRKAIEDERAKRALLAAPPPSGPTNPKGTPTG